MIAQRPPTSIGDSSQNFRLDATQFQEFQVVGDTPQRWQMPECRTDIAQVDRCLATAFDDDRLMCLSVSAGQPRFDAGENFHIAVDQSELPRLFERHEMWQ